MDKVKGLNESKLKKVKMTKNLTKQITEIKKTVNRMF